MAPKNSSAPRIFGLHAQNANRVVLIKRGPAQWTQVLLWETAINQIQEGAWIHGRLFPQRCDVSADGRWLCSMIYKGNNKGPLTDSYVVISKVPWLTALVGWGYGTTYARGFHFVADRSVWKVGEPDLGSHEQAQRRFGLDFNRSEQFSVEKRTGWSETAQTETRAEKDVWDEKRKVVMAKAQTNAKSSKQNSFVLQVEGKSAAFRGMPRNDQTDWNIKYTLSCNGNSQTLDAQWADWSHDGHLLLATNSGLIQKIAIEEGNAWKVVFSQDLSLLNKPKPQPAPNSAKTWD